MAHHILAIFGLPGGAEWILITVVALLIFGRRLPDVARSVGKSIVEFKKGLRDVKGEIDIADNSRQQRLPGNTDNSTDHSSVNNSSVNNSSAQGSAQTSVAPDAATKNKSD